MSLQPSSELVTLRPQIQSMNSLVREKNNSCERAEKKIGFPQSLQLNKCIGTTAENTTHPHFERNPMIKSG